MYAVVKTGGKQLRVEVGETVSVELLDAAAGAVVTLPALLVSDGESIVTGAEAANATVTAEVLGHGKADKVVVFKFKKRKGYKKLKGHRQNLTLIKVTDIAVAGAQEGRQEGRCRRRPPRPRPSRPRRSRLPRPRSRRLPKAAGEEGGPEGEAGRQGAGREGRGGQEAGRQEGRPRKKLAAEKPAAKKPAAKKADSASAAKKPAAKKPAAKKTAKPADSAE